MLTLNMLNSIPCKVIRGLTHCAVPRDLPVEEDEREQMDLLVHRGSGVAGGYLDLLDPEDPLVYQEGS